MLSNTRWLDIVRHRVRGFRVPYRLILQHHDSPATTMLAAPVTLPLAGDRDSLAPRLTIGDKKHRVRLLDISAVSRGMLSETVASAVGESDAIRSVIDIILHGYPAERPR